jgi:hypothetical protein
LNLCGVDREKTKRRSPAAAKPAAHSANPETATESVDPEPSAPVAGPLQREEFSDPVAGYSVKLPPGYKKLSEDETHAIFEGLSEFWGKEISERARSKPPAWFRGPADPKLPNAPPPMFAVAYADLSESIDPAQLTAYKDKLEEEYKRQGNKYGEINIQVVKVDGITSLEVENDVFSRINNERSRLLRVAVPGKGRWYDLSFMFGNDQSEAVHAALKDVLDSFKVMEHPAESVQNQIRWTRVLMYTAGFGLAGVVLSLLLRKLSGAK